MIEKEILDAVLPVPKLEELRDKKVEELKAEGFVITNFHSGGVFYTLLMIVCRIKIEIMSYNPTQWRDDVYDAQTGELIQEGVPVDQQRLYNFETGILAGHELAAFLLLHQMENRRLMDAQSGEVGEIALTNSLDYPFNDSGTMIQLQSARNHLTYRVETEVLTTDGFVGDIEIRDKALDSFKIQYTGSARNVTLRYFVIGGI